MQRIRQLARAKKVRESTSHERFCVLPHFLTKLTRARHVGYTDTYNRGCYNMSDNKLVQLINLPMFQRSIIPPSTDSSGTNF